MAPGRPVPQVILTPELKEQLLSMTRSRSLLYPVIRRAKIVLLAADRLNNKTIAQKVGISAAMVGLWWQRFHEQGVVGRYDQPKPDGPRSIVDEQIAWFIRKTLKTNTKEGTHWSCRSISQRLNCLNPPFKASGKPVASNLTVRNTLSSLPILSLLKKCEILLASI